jgi:hypothetical protein
MKSSLVVLFCLITLVSAAIGQSSKRNARPANPKPAATPQKEADPAPTPTPSTKRNERPQNTDGSGKTPSSQTAATPNYIYQFDQPNFVVSHIVIEHDESGKGKITFMKRGLEDPESDPITLTPVTMDKIKAALTALNFLDSTETYQTVRDYSHMGNVTLTYRKDSRERTVKYNWTDNKDAKALMDEYRKIGVQYVWQFDMSISRENQPLNAPGLMDELDSYLRRSEISDPQQMLPLLKELSNDERIPLIARNHAKRLVEKIEKDKK